MYFSSSFERGAGRGVFIEPKITVCIALHKSAIKRAENHLDSHKIENIAGRESKSKVLGKKEMRWALFCLLACLLVGSDTPFLGSQL